MTPQKEQDIKVVASRIQRILKGSDGLTYANFTDDLDTLIKLILEEERGE